MFSDDSISYLHSQNGTKCLWRVFVRVKFYTLVTVVKGMIQRIDIQHAPEWGVEKKNGECILGDLDHQMKKKKSLRKTLSTSFYSPSPVKED